MIFAIDLDPNTLIKLLVYRAGDSEECGSIMRQVLNLIFCRTCYWMIVFSWIRNIFIYILFFYCFEYKCILVAQNQSFGLNSVSINGWKKYYKNVSINPSAKNGICYEYSPID